MTNLNSNGIENEINIIRMNLEQLLKDLNNYQEQTRKKRAGQNLFTELGRTYLKREVGVAKKNTQSVINILKSNENIPQEYFDRFNNELNRLKVFLGQVSEKIETGRENSSKLVKSINQILNPKQLYTQVKHSINFCNQLKNKTLVSNEELRQIRSDYRKSRDEIMIKNSENINKPKVKILKRLDRWEWLQMLGAIGSIVTIIGFGLRFG